MASSSGTGPSRDAPSGAELIARTIASFDDPLVRAYCVARFRIIHQRFLDELLQFLPKEGTVLELGCGFGLFGLYFAQYHPGLTLHGLDLNRQRIEMAQRAAVALNVSNVTFYPGDATTLQLTETYDAIYMLDIMHHIPPDQMPRLLEQLQARLRPGGVLLIKDVDTFPRRKRYFTWLLDVLMTRGELPHYWPSHQMIALLRAAGFQVFSHDMVDILPYPHRLYFCLKGGLEHLTGAQTR